MYKLLRLEGRSTARATIAYAIVDNQDYDMLVRYQWSYIAHGYAYTIIGGQKVNLHRVLMCPPQNMVVDHINGIRLDNRRSNLRVVSQAENMRNKHQHLMQPPLFQCQCWWDATKTTIFVRVNNRVIARATSWDVANTMLNDYTASAMQHWMNHHWRPLWKGGVK
jgi:hypothetical protein